MHSIPFSHRPEAGALCALRWRRPSETTPPPTASSEGQRAGAESSSCSAGVPSTTDRTRQTRCCRCRPCLASRRQVVSP
eukprot:5181894-Prymnesium_polylepis.1